MNTTNLSNEALALARRLPPRERLQLAACLTASVEQEVAVQQNATPEEH